MRFIRERLTSHRAACVPTALAVLLERPYEKVNNYLRAKGARKTDNSGTTLDLCGLTATLGFTKHLNSDFGSITVRQFLDKIEKSGDKRSYLLRVNGHVLAIKNGFIHDTIDSSKRIIKEAWIKDRPMYDTVFTQYALSWELRLKKIEREAKKEVKKKVVAKKNKVKRKEQKKDINFQLEQLLKRRKAWSTKLKRAQTAIKKLDRLIKNREKKINIPEVQLLQAAIS